MLRVWAKFFTIYFSCSFSAFAVYFLFTCNFVLFFRVGDNKMLKSVRNQNKNKHKRTVSTEDCTEKKQVKMEED